MKRASIAASVATSLLASALPMAALAVDDGPGIAETRKAKIARCIRQANKELKGTGGLIRKGQFDNIVLGSPGPDNLMPDASPGRDLICGFGGDDVGYGADPAPGGRFAKGDVFVGGGGNDEVTELYGGTFVGGSGRDGVFLMHWGLHVGGSGHDWAEHMEGGRYFGGDGDDRVHTKTGGTFWAGPGDDDVDNSHAGTIYGGAGADEVLILEPGAVFKGGAGVDRVDHVLGVFRGGDGGDRVVQIHPVGKFYGQRGPDLGGVVSGLFSGGRGNDHVCDLTASGRYYGGAGIDKLDLAEVGANWFGVERRVVCPF